MAEGSVRRNWAPTLLSAFFVLCFGTADPLDAQSTTASLSGKVCDPQRSALPQALIVVTSRDTSRVLRTASDADGKFRLTALAPGVYELTRRGGWLRPAPN